LVLAINATLIGGTPDLVLFCDEKRDSVKIIDWKSGALTNQMQLDYKRTQDSKLGYIHKQLSMYGYMLKQLFGFKSVHAVAVFCSKLGFAEFEFKLACNEEIMQWVSEYNDDNNSPMQSDCVRRIVETSDQTADRMSPRRVLSMAPGRPKLRQTAPILGNL